MKKTLITLIALSVGSIGATAIADGPFTCPPESQITVGYSDSMKKYYGTSNFNSGGNMPSGLQGNSLTGLPALTYWGGLILDGNPTSPEELKFTSVSIDASGVPRCLYTVAASGGSVHLTLLPGNGGKNYTFTLSNGQSSSNDIGTTITATPTSTSDSK